MKERVQSWAEPWVDEALGCIGHKVVRWAKAASEAAGVLIDEVSPALFDEPLANLDPKSGGILI